MSRKCFISIFFLMTAVFADALTIYMKEKVVLSTPVLTAGDVITLPDSYKAYKNIPLTIEKSRLQNSLIIIYPAYIKKILENSIKDENIMIVGGYTLLIPASMIDGRLMSFYDELACYLDSYNTVPSYRLEIDTIISSVIPSDAYDFIFSFIDVPDQGNQPQSSYLSGKKAINFETIDKKQWTKGNLSVVIRNYIPAATASKNILPDNNLTADNVVFKELDASLITGEVISDSAGLEKYTAIDLVKKESLLLKKNFKTVKLVKTGDTVLISFFKGNIQLEMEGKAAGSGELGDIIDVKTTLSNLSFRGEVIGEKEVSVAIE